MKEILGKRTINTKTFNAGGNARSVRVGMKPLHYKNDPASLTEEWKDIDLTIRQEGSRYVMRESFYEIEIWSDEVRYKHKSKRGYETEVRLKKVGNKVPDYSNVTVEVDKNKITWKDVDTDLDIELILREDDNEVFKVLKTDLAPKGFEWEVIEPDLPGNHPAKFIRKTEGWDSEASTNGNRLELDNKVLGESNVDGKKNFVFKETWTGRVGKVKDKKTRKKEWKSDKTVYPVRIDATVTENIVAGADDVREDILGVSSTTTALNSAAGNMAIGWRYVNTSLTTFITQTRQNGGFRFQTVPIPKLQLSVQHS